MRLLRSREVLAASRRIEGSKGLFIPLILRKPAGPSRKTVTPDLEGQPPFILRKPEGPSRRIDGENCSRPCES